MNILLTIPEELFLLTVNEKTGRKAPIRSKKFDILLSASILMELALQNRIDTDPQFVIPDKTDPTGISFLDETIDLINRSEKQEKISWWLLRLSERAARYREMLITGLIGKGLLRMESERIFLGFSTSVYPILLHDTQVREVKSRVRGLLAGSDIPELRDMVIISIAWYGGLLNYVMDDEMIRSCRPRIEQLARMDLVGQAISKSMKELSLSLALTMRAREILAKKTPAEKLDDLVEEMKALMQVASDGELPEWLRKGTVQYLKTLDYIRETRTNEILFNTKTGQYGLKIGANPVL